MRILAYSAYFTPEIAASMYLIEDVLEGFAKAGHYVDLYVPVPCRGVSDEVRNEYKKRKTEVRYDGHLTIHRFSLYKEGKNPIRRALRYAFLNIAFIWKGLFTKANIIFAQSTPPTQGMMAGIVRAMKRIPFVYCLQDIFPDSLVNTGLTKEGSILWKIGRRIEDYSYRSAGKIIVISEDFKQNIMAKGVPEEKIAMIPNWPDTAGVYPVERKDNILFDRYGLDREKFYIAYSGNIGHTQNMDLLLDAAKEIQDESRDVRFVILGDGAAKESVEKRIREEKIGNVILLPFQPYEDIAHVFSLGDVGLIISKPGIGNNSVPSKTWGYMAAHKPILASFDANSDLTEIIKRVECGIVAEADKKDDLVKAIRTMKEDPDLPFKGEKGANFLKNELDKDKCVGEYVRIIEETAK